MRLAIILALAACSPRPQALEPVAMTPTPHCFRLVFRFEGRDQAAMACAESPALCANAQRRASRWGGAMGAKEVGQCQSTR